MIYSYSIANDSEKATILKNVGYTGYELGLAGATEADAADIDSFEATIKELGLKCVSCNGMFPSEIKLLEGEAGYPAIIEYLNKALPLAKRFGTPIVVLGSGGARTIPEGMSREEAVKRFTSLLRDVVSPMAAEYGVIVAIEELRASECNFINTCKEAMEIVRLVDRPNIKLLVDYFHASFGDDTLEEIAAFKDDIVHVHIASPKNNRSAPNEDDYEDLVEFFGMLKRIGYSGAISIEAGRSDLATAGKVALELMNKAWEQV